MVVGGIICTATGVGSALGGSLISAGVGSIVNGYINEATGGSFDFGYFGGMISGALTGLGAGLGGEMISNAFKVCEATVSNVFRFFGGCAISAVGGFAGNMLGSMFTAKMDGILMDSQYYKNLLSSSVCLGAMNIGAGFLSSISITLVNETVKNGSQIAFSVFGTSLAMSTEALYDLGSYYIPKLISNL